MEKQKGFAPIFILIGIVVVGLIGGSYFLLRPKAPIDHSLTSKLNIEISPTVAAQPTQQTQASPPLSSPTSAQPTASTQSTPTVTPTTALDTSSIVIFENEGAIPQQDKDGITKRVIEPFILYYQDNPGQGVLKQFTVKINTNANKAQYPYLAYSRFTNGVTYDFVITRTSGKVDWWAPECMGPCPFSATFKSKYPEIVAKVGN